MLDERDQAIFAKRQAAFRARQEIKSGDFVRFADGKLLRVSHVWTDENDKPESIQTSRNHGDSSFYFGDGYMSFSGGLYPGIPSHLFTRTNETMKGYAWFFHHDHHCAHNGITVQVECPVWACSQNSPD